MTPLIITLTGPTCAGKSTLEDMLMQVGFAGVISTTTRPPRAGEKTGEDYYFIDYGTFDEMFDDGQFVEAVTFNGHWYGVTKAEVERITLQGKPIVVVCEPNGREQIKRYCEDHGWDFYAVFVNAPDQVIAERFVRRLLSEERTLFNEEKLIKTFASRMKMMMTTERGWILDACTYAGTYDFNISRFDEEVQSAIVDHLVGVARRYDYLRDAA